MPEFAGPMLRRWELGNALRRIREERTMTIADVTAAMKERYGSSFSTTKLSRMETAKRGVIPRDVHDLCVLYEVSDDEREHLMELAKSAREQDEWHENAGLRDYTRFFALEQIARREREYSLLYVPALLQIEEYARHVEDLALLAPEYYGWIENPEASSNRVDIRIQRQMRLEGVNPLELHVVIDENVLRRRLPSDKVMADQLLHLLESCQKQNVRIQVIPMDVGIYPGTESTGWCILDLPEIPGQPSACSYIEASLGGILVERAFDISRLSSAFDVLSRLALSDEESTERIRGALNDLKPTS